MTPKNFLPRTVYLMLVHGGLLAGSVARRLSVGDDIDECNDFDILVPLDKWQTIALLIPDTAKPNKFGGWRFKDDKDNEIDVWPDQVFNYLKNCKAVAGESTTVYDFINNRAYTAKHV